MTVEVTVAFHHVAPSDALEAAIRDHAAQLEKFAADLRRCDVTVACETPRHHHGTPYRIGMRIALSGQRIDVDTTHADDAYAAVNAAFDAAKRQITDHVRRRSDVRLPQRRSG